MRPIHYPTHLQPWLQHQQRLRRRARRTLALGLISGLLWLGANLVEWTSGWRLLPWSAYGNCAPPPPSQLPGTVRLGLYEEFPTPERLARLAQLDFPVTLAVAATSRDAFLELQDAILGRYPQVQELYFWPLLSQAEGYYPGTWSDPAAVRRVAGEAAGLPVLWDLEMPRDKSVLSLHNRLENGAFLNRWLGARQTPVHVWRSNASMGFDSLFLRLMGMHLDPRDYPMLWLHLDLYHARGGISTEAMTAMLRCGVERYGERFIPALGVLDDGEGETASFISVDTFRRDLSLAREAGSAEIWLFGLNGLSDEYLAVIREVLPLDSLVSSQ